MRQWLVGFTGRAESGKTTAAAVLERHGYSRCSFATPIKTIAFSMGWDGLKDDRGRRLLQHLGTECGRQCIGENCWVDLWAEQNAFRLTEKLLIVVDDVRFDNETEILRRLGGIVLRVERDRIEDAWWPWENWSKPNRKHASESGILRRNIDGVINNNYDVHDLEREVETLIIGGEI